MTRRPALDDDLDPTDPTPEETRWIRRLSRLLKDQPRGLCVFVGSGSVVVMRTAPDGGMPHVPGLGGGVDPAMQMSEQPGTSRGWDGGDW